MYETEKELSDEIRARYEAEYGRDIGRDRITPAIIRVYVKELLKEAMRMYVETKSEDYVLTIKTLLRMFYISEFDGKPRRRQGGEAELITDLIMQELYEEMPPKKIAELAVTALPDIRRERDRETSKKKYEERKITNGLSGGS